MRAPLARGPISSSVLSWLHREVPVHVPPVLDLIGRLDDTDPVTDDDLQLTLWLLYELHYRGFDDVDDSWEWSPGCLTVRAALELRFEAALRARTVDGLITVQQSELDVAATLFALVEGSESAPLARHLQRTADAEQIREFLAHRSITQLKEADPYTWVIPRLGGRPKVALVELQFDEYGAGSYARMHARMFADTLAECGLDPSYGAYVDSVPAVTLSVGNLASMVGLHRRLRGAAIGHLAAIEATSSIPARRIAIGLRRVGFSALAAVYFDEHVEADAVHEQVVMRDICAALVAEDATLLHDIAFGVAACLELDLRSARHLLDRWAIGASSLNRQVGVSALPA
jgi:hypothetical protein